MSFDEEHLDEHYPCQQAYEAMKAERDALAADLRSADVLLKGRNERIAYLEGRIAALEAEPEACRAVSAATLTRADKLEAVLRGVIEPCRKGKGFDRHIWHSDCPRCMAVAVARKLLTSTAETKAEQPYRRVAAWIRGHMSPSSPSGPAEYDEECYPGEDPADDSPGWQPLYRAEMEGDANCLHRRGRDNTLECAAIRLLDAISKLGEFEPVTRVTYFEASPTKNAEAHKRWVELNDAGALVRRVLADRKASEMKGDLGNVFGPQTAEEMDQIQEPEVACKCRQDDGEPSPTCRYFNECTVKIGGDSK